MGLAGILDMYYEDIFSLPNKQLSCGVVTNYTNLPSKKVLKSIPIVYFILSVGLMLSLDFM